MASGNLVAALLLVSVQPAQSLVVRPSLAPRPKCPRGPAPSVLERGFVRLCEENGADRSEPDASGARSFGEYLLPYAGLTLLALAFASAAFAWLVLGGF